MIASENDREFLSLENIVNRGSQFPAYRVNLCKVLEFLFESGKRGGTRHVQIAEIANFISQCRNSVRESGYTYSRRPHIDAGHARAEAERHAQNRDSLFCSGKIRRYVW